MHLFLFAFTSPFICPVINLTEAIAGSTCVANFAVSSAKLAVVVLSAVGTWLM
jgi:hypothetical protein